MGQNLSYYLTGAAGATVLGLGVNEMFKAMNPRSNKIKDMKFLLCTPTSCVTWSFDNMRYISSVFDPKKDTKILVHGFITNAKGEFPKNVKDAYLETQPNDYNIICVEWGQLAGRSIVDYPGVLENLPSVAECITEFLYWLVNTMGLDLAKVHLIGHSLGAHLSGLVGLTVQDYGHKLGMITGLDAAARKFGGQNAFRHVERSDANYVEGVHTSDVLGTTDLFGHKDIFVNGGRKQPNCRGRDFLGSCSHSEAHRIFARAIRKNDVTYQFKSLGAHASTSSSTNPTKIPEDLYLGTTGMPRVGRKRPSTFPLSIHDYNLEIQDWKEYDFLDRKVPRLDPPMPYEDGCLGLPTPNQLHGSKD